MPGDLPLHPTPHPSPPLLGCEPGEHAGLSLMETPEAKYLGCRAGAAGIQGCEAKRTQRRGEGGVPAGAGPGCIGQSAG